MLLLKMNQPKNLASYETCANCFLEIYNLWTQKRKKSQFPSLVGLKQQDIAKHSAGSRS